MLHAEVKFTRSPAVHDWLDQARGDAASYQLPYVAWKQNGKDWVVILDKAAFFELAKMVYDRGKK